MLTWNLENWEIMWQIRWLGSLQTLNFFLRRYRISSNLRQFWAWKNSIDHSVVTTSISYPKVHECVIYVRCKSEADVRKVIILSLWIPIQFLVQFLVREYFPLKYISKWLTVVITQNDNTGELINVFPIPLRVCGRTFQMGRCEVVTKAAAHFEITLLLLFLLIHYTVLSSVHSFLNL